MNTWKENVLLTAVFEAAVSMAIQLNCETGFDQPKSVMVTIMSHDTFFPVENVSLVQRETTVKSTEGPKRIRAHVNMILWDMWQITVNEMIKT